MVIDAILWAAMLAAAIGAVAGNRTAWVLLASVFLARGLDLAGLHPGLWFCIAADIVVVAALLLVRRNRRDIAVLALFVPIWALYAVPDSYAAISLIVSAQMLLSFPMKRAWVRAKETPMPDPIDHFDLRVRHGVA